jgi:IPT/TIG domain
MFTRKYGSSSNREFQLGICLMLVLVLGTTFLAAQTATTSKPTWTKAQSLKLNELQSALAQTAATTAAAPVVSSVSPNTGSTNGGTAVTITGSGFVSPSTVTIGGVLAQAVTVVSSTQIKCNVPTHAAGTQTIVVSNANGSSSPSSGFTYTLPSSGIAFVQTNNVTNNPGASSMKVAYPLAQVAGHTNIVVIGWNDMVTHINSVTDSVGNVYKPVFQFPTFGNELQQTIYYAANIKSANANANSVTVTFNQVASFGDVRILEYKGLNATSPLDTSIFGWGSSTLGSTFSLTTHAAPELLLAATTVTNATTNAGSSYSLVYLTKFNDIVEQRIVTSIGTYTASAPLSPSGPYVIQLVAFKP